MAKALSIHIVFPFTAQPWGGGNQFLHALRDALIRQSCYSETAVNADVILFNSHHDLRTVIALKIRYPHKIFLHRVDGPLTRVRGGGVRNYLTDRFIFFMSNRVADVTIFQSQWSRDNAVVFGYYTKPRDVVIHNASNPKIFYPQERFMVQPKRKIRLIITSWSDNMRKGFDVYSFLDTHLDFSRFDCTFVGNSPVSFKNIRQLPPMNSLALAEMLRQSDIYVTASQSDPCSNSLIEALSCGLPAVALADGGHPELIGGGGVLFHGTQDVLAAIDTVVQKYSIYQTNLPQYDIDAITQQYRDAA